MNGTKLMVCILAMLVLLPMNAWADVVEDFEDGVANDWKITAGNWEVVEAIQADGTLGKVLKQTANDRPQGGIGNAIIVYECGYEWTDYTFEADVKMDSGYDYWMAWRSGITGQNYAQWFPGWMRATWSGPYGWGVFGYYSWNWAYGNWYHMKAVLNGPNQKFYVNDNLLFELNKDMYTRQGTVNFRTLRSFMTLDNIKITGVDGCTPPVIQVDIDIKPGSDPNSINLNNNGVIPVAVLMTDEFDAAEVDSDTVRFGPFEAAPVHSALEDVDEDGDIDMILHFNTLEVGIGAGDTEAILTGETGDGQKIEGSDSVRPIDNAGKKK